MVGKVLEKEIRTNKDTGEVTYIARVLTDVIKYGKKTKDVVDIKVDEKLFSFLMPEIDYDFDFVIEKPKYYAFINNAKEL